MEKILADFLQRQKSGLKAEATALLATADNDSGGTMTAEQDARFKAIEGDVAMIDAQLAAAQKTAETPEEIAIRVRGEIADVTAACTLAGKPEKAAEFIKAGTPLPQVISALQADRATSEDISTRNSGKSRAAGDLTWSEFRARRAG
jgi:hypothetical protein